MRWIVTHVEWNSISLNRTEYDATQNSDDKIHTLNYTWFKDSKAFSEEKSIAEDQNYVKVDGLSPKTTYHIQVFSEGLHGKSLIVAVNVSTLSIGK